MLTIAWNIKSNGSSVQKPTMARRNNDKETKESNKVQIAYQNVHSSLEIFKMLKKLIMT